MKCYTLQVTDSPSSYLTWASPLTDITTWSVLWRLVCPLGRARTCVMGRTEHWVGKQMTWIHLKFHNLVSDFGQVTLPRQPRFCCLMYFQNFFGESNKIMYISSGWCGSVDWIPACEPKGHWFDSQSGYMPGLQTKLEGQPHIDVSLPLFLPPFPSL